VRKRHRRTVRNDENASEFKRIAMSGAGAEQGISAKDQGLRSFPVGNLLTNWPRPNSRSCCPKMPRKRSATAFAPSAPKPARSVLIGLKWRAFMHQASEHIGAIAAALARAQAELTNPERP
jgi:hypothetical protein